MTTTWQIICFSLLIVNVALAARLISLFNVDAGLMPWKATAGELAP
jgi:hypothetical protein